MNDPLTTLSDALAAHVATAAPGLVALHPGTRAQRTGFIWQSDLLVTSEQNLPSSTDVPAILPGGASATATILGRDPGTNVAILRLTLDAPALPDATPATGALALALGSAAGEPTAALGVIHQTGPAWDSMAGGTIDRLIRLDLRLASIAEGGPVLDAAGALIGMSTFGPRRRVLVIPAATVRRVLPALAQGQATRGWLGLGLQPVGLTPAMQTAAGRPTGLMVISIAPGSPAEHGAVLPGDILLDVNNLPAPNPGAVARALSSAAIGQVIPLRLLRAGNPIELNVTIAARPKS